MPKKWTYDINAAWDDPTERPDPREDRRRSQRYGVSIRIKIRAENNGQSAVGPGLLRNLSTRGAWCMTKHDLEPGQHIQLKFNTRDCPPDMDLPKYFVGWSQVTRVESVDSKRKLAGLEFAEEFSEDIRFALFVDYMQFIEGATTPH